MFMGLETCVVVKDTIQNSIHILNAFLVFATFLKNR